MLQHCAVARTRLWHHVHQVPSLLTSHLRAARFASAASALSLLALFAALIPLVEGTVQQGASRCVRTMGVGEPGTRERKDADNAAPYPTPLGHTGMRSAGTCWSHGRERERGFLEKTVSSRNFERRIDAVYECGEGPIFFSVWSVCFFNLPLSLSLCGASLFERKTEPRFKFDVICIYSIACITVVFDFLECRINDLESELIVIYATIYNMWFRL